MTTEVYENPLEQSEPYFSDPHGSGSSTAQTIVLVAVSVSMYVIAKHYALKLIRKIEARNFVKDVSTEK